MVNDLILQILIFAYASVGIISTIGYFPTIKDLYKHKRKSANINSYILWNLASGITFLYALFILSDLLLRIITGLNFACCVLILVLSLRLRNI